MAINRHKVVHKSVRTNTKVVHKSVRTNIKVVHKSVSKAIKVVHKSVKHLYISFIFSTFAANLKHVNKIHIYGTANH